MIYQHTSVKNVMARIIRNTGSNMPGHFLDLMLEWIPEAMEELQTPYQHVLVSSPSLDCPGAIHTSNHVAKLPCGLLSLEAVEDERGQRLRNAMAVTDITKPSTRYEKYSSNLNRAGDAARPTNFQKDVTQTTGFDPATSTPGQQSPWDGRDLIPDDFPETAEYYKIQGGYIQTSAPEMFVKLHYYAMPVDGEGYPMIPDVTEYKEALYWYVLSKMIGAGYKHPVIPANVQGMEYAYEKYEFHAGRALGRIMLPSQDKMARLRDGFAQRMVPPQHFYDDFGIGGEQIQANRYI